MKKRVTIIGAGPAGLFAAYELCSSSTCEINIIEAGGTIEERVKSKDVLRGIGGGGLMSDGKLIFDTRIGNNLGEILVKEENERLTSRVESTFLYFGVLESKSNPEKANILERKALKHGIDFIYPNQSHIGTDKLIPLMKDFQRYLEDQGVKFFTNISVSNVLPESDFIILAPGRSSGETGWMEKTLRDNGISYGYRPIDIGVRIEVPSLITDEITDISRDLKFYLRTATYQDKIRTFCTCPNGFVTQEDHTEFKTVNGHSESGKATQNTNFALLATVELTRPLTNYNEFARYVGLLFNSISGGKTLAQRWGDIIRYKRSKEEKQKEYLFESTLKDVTWGDLATAMPPRYWTDIIEGVKRLDKIIPGLASDSTILHAPEIKFYGLKITTDTYLKAKNGIYVAGDGSGYSRGIVGAAASGLRAAEGILREI